MANQKRKSHRAGELDALFFDKLPQRAKEIFFEFLSSEFPYDGDKAFFVDVAEFYNEDCESPIEQIFYFAFQIICFIRNDMPYTHYANLLPQCEILANGNKYRADFYFDPSCEIDNYDKSFKLIIECDGHDFHERTKAQVIKGNQRDYDLKIAGYDVLHFSGSQIYNEPFKCAEEAYNYIVTKLK